MMEVCDWKFRRNLRGGGIQGRPTGHTTRPVANLNSLVSKRAAAATSFVRQVGDEAGTTVTRAGTRVQVMLPQQEKRDRCYGEHESPNLLEYPTPRHLALASRGRDERSMRPATYTFLIIESLYLNPKGSCTKLVQRPISA